MAKKNIILSFSFILGKIAFTIASFIFVGFAILMLFVFFSIIDSCTSSRVSDYAAETSLVEEKEAAEKPEEEMTLQEIAEKKAAEEKTAWLSDIETHYNALIDHINADEIDKAYPIAKQFEVYEQTDYKEVAQMVKGTMFKKTLQDLDNTAAEDSAKRLQLLNKLLEYDPDNENFKTERDYYAESVANKKAREERSKKIRRWFSLWNGEHAKVRFAIKRYLNDPSSYRHIETQFADMGDHLVINTAFRAKNQYGALMIYYARATVDLDGNVTELKFVNR